jgi:hypothetical protein
MPFTTDDVVVRSWGPYHWQLEQDLRYVGETDTWDVPAGFVTDFATVPTLVTWLVPRYGAYTRAAITHDYLITAVLPTGSIAPLDVDGIFRRIMRELGVPAAQRWVMWAGVRWGSLFGGRATGWFTPAPAAAVLGITLAVLPILLVSLPGVLLGAGVFKLAELVGRK